MSALSRVNAWVPLGGRLGCGLQGRTWFRANSLAFRRSRRGFARIPLRFDAPAVVSREFPCVSTLPLWFRANSQAFRRSRRGFAPIPIAFGRSRCGVARIPASSGLLWPLLGGRLGCGPQRRTRWGATFVCSRCGFTRIPMRFDAPAVVSREFPCVSKLPLGGMPIRPPRCQRLGLLMLSCANQPGLLDFY